MAASGSILGNAVLRKEDTGLLKGANKYFDDIAVDGTAHVVFVRSNEAHGTITGIDTSEATGMPGVVAVYTADNMELATFQGFPMLPDTLNRPPLATGKVRFVGDIVAAVVGETAAQAKDAAESIFVDIEPLPVVVDIEAGMAEDAPLLFEDHGSNICFATAHPAPAEDGTPPPDVDPLAGADHVASARIVTQRLAGVPMENNGILAVPESDGRLTCYVPTQAPHSIHPAIAGGIGMEPEQVRVTAQWVGGGFGPKAAMYVEYIIAAKAATTLGRPVKWTETRSENMVSMCHGRDMIMYADLGIKNDGKIVGMNARVIADGGSYPAIGAVLPMLTQMLSQAVYDIPVIKFQAHTVVTNTTFTGAYRGAGRPEATQMVERIIDVAAKKIGMDPAEVRRANYIPNGSYPYMTQTGANYDEADHELALDQVLEASGYADLRAQQAARRESGGTKQLGIGVSSYVEVTAPLGLHVEYGKVKVHTDGMVDAIVGTSVHGQGHDTAFSMIVSDMLGVPMENVRLVNSDTDEVPRGSGTLGSRSLQTAGSAVHVASTEVLGQAKQLAAHLLEANVDDIVKGENGLQVAGVPAQTLSWAELATAAADASKRPEGMSEELAHELDFDGTDSTFPFGSHVAVVEVDTETGKVDLLRHIAVDDCGRILNPMLVAGQQHGGIAQGIAQALYEHVQYDEAGNPVSANLMDYLMPSAAEMPSFEASNTETASPRNPLGAKGIGESGTIGSTPAVHNAVVDAISHLGVDHVDMPLSPERVWSAINAA